MTVRGFDYADCVHRLVKEAVDRGTAGSLEEAVSQLKNYRLVLEIGGSESYSAPHQAALLTAVALGRRMYLGGVSVHVGADAPLLVPLPLPRSLKRAIVALGGRLSSEHTPNEVPRIIIGGRRRGRRAAFEVRTVAAGWRGGVVPIDAVETCDSEAMPLAAMFAAALAISESFLYVRGENGAAGARSVGLSLWNPGHGDDWLVSAADEPRLSFLPSRLWLLGLGHLGQAYLWALGLLPYTGPKSLELVLQDVDVITPSTESTSILSDARLVAQKKTRAMSNWAEHRGFVTSIHERRFAAGFRRQEDEPPVLLCGLDNAHGRRTLDSAGFEFVVEAGLGSGYEDFRALRMHTLPASRSAAQIWPNTSKSTRVNYTPAYTKLINDGLVDRCGMTLLADKAVGAPFVGAVAATLVVAEVLRLLHGGTCLQLVDLDLQWPEHCTIVPQRLDFRNFNPGFLRVA
jgi:hypothetical protein